MSVLGGLWLQGVFGLALVSILAPSAAAEASKARHAAILARALSYELTLEQRAGASVDVAVLFRPSDARSSSDADHWSRALSDLSSLKIQGRPFSVRKLVYDAETVARAIDQDGIDVLLVSEAMEEHSDPIARLARSKQVLSVSSDAALVEKNMTLCVAEQDGKPRVIINLRSAQQEGVRFSSNLLKVARLIR